jgi:nicotinamide riboside transporter PnuC
MSWMAKITTSLEERLGLWGFWVVAFYYTTREAGQFGGAAPWWDSVMDVLAPVAVGLLLNVAL